MSKASEYAATMKDRPPRFDCKDRRVAEVTDEGNLYLSPYSYLLPSSEALKFAAWINATFGETDTGGDGA